MTIDWPSWLLYAIGFLSLILALLGRSTNRSRVGRDFLHFSFLYLLF
jgi:hypothetical protein